VAQLKINKREKEKAQMGEGPSSYAGHGTRKGAGLAYSRVTRLDDNRETRFVLHPKKVVLFITLVVVGLVLCHFVTQVAKFQGGQSWLTELERQFDLGNENNIATWYSSTTLFLSAMLLAVIGLHKKQIRGVYARHWLALAGIFVLLALDETASIHEKAKLFQPYLKQFDYFGGYFYYSWVAVGLCFVLAVGGAYLRFLAHLPEGTRRLFVVAGVLYVGGALGLEMIESRLDFLQGGHESLAYQSLVGVEEACEMMGIVLFIYALLSYIGSTLSSVRIVVSQSVSK
jgi:hypothetical protein